MSHPDCLSTLLSAIDNSLRTGSHMTGANLALDILCDDLGLERDRLPVFEPGWARDLPDVCACDQPDCPWNRADRTRRLDAADVEENREMRQSMNADGEL